MTTIVLSLFEFDEQEQVGGGHYVVERHTDNFGRELTFGPWLCLDGMDPEAVMMQRAGRLNAEFALREAEETEAAQGRIPWSKLDFRDQLGVDAEELLDELRAELETNPAFDIGTRRKIRTGFARYDEAQYIQRPLRADVLAMLGLFQVLGILTQERIDAITAAANS